MRRCSGGFVTVQPQTGPAYTVDGWMDVPGRDATPPVNTWDIATQYGGGLDITIGPGSVAVHGAVASLGLGLVLRRSSIFLSCDHLRFPLNLLSRTRRLEYSKAEPVLVLKVRR